MKDIYFFTIIGKIGFIAAITAVVSLFAWISTLLWIFLDDLEPTVQLKRLLKKAAIIFLVSATIATFTPNRKELLMIYGVGGTIDYLKKNKEAAKLPDSVVHKLVEWLDAEQEDSQDK